MNDISDCKRKNYTSNYVI